ncbi:MAG: hypothetical protein PHC31_13040 [Clostridia bacterium]|nr:hypothetical protein [Clostridia bacterium]
MRPYGEKEITKEYTKLTIRVSVCILAILLSLFVFSQLYNPIELEIKRYLRPLINDPSNFKIVSVEKVDEISNDSIVGYYVTFRGTNYFGGIILQDMIVYATPKNKIIDHEN